MEHFVRVPEAFSAKQAGGNPAQAWDRWLVKFNIFLQATGAEDKTDKVKIGLLLNHIGDEGIEIFQNFTFLPERADPNGGEEDRLPAENKDNFETVLQKFAEYYHKRDPQLMLREQYWFHLHRQPEQTFDAWLRVVREKATACRFQNTDEMIRDKLIFSCKDDTAKMKLYDIGPKLTLQKTQDILYMRELSRKELEGSKLSSVGRVRNAGPRQQSDGARQHQQKGQFSLKSASEAKQKRQNSDRCRFCNRFHAPGKKNCPAAKPGQTCDHCRKPGHWQSVCISKAKGEPAAIREVVHEGHDDSFDDNSFLIGGVQDRSHSGRDQGWHITLTVGKQKLDWCIDTGAQVSVMPTHVYKPDFGELRQSDSTLYGPSDQPLDVKGFVDMNLVMGKNTVRERVYVVAKASKLLLGSPAIRKLGLIKNIPGAFSIRAIRSMAKNSETSKPQVEVNFGSASDVKQKYPKLWSGLGKLDGELHIEITDGAKPFAQTVPRRVPVPLLGKVEAELDKMVNLDVIEPVDTPTDWCAPLVVVPKPNGNVRLCVDLTKLNKSVKREAYAMPSVEETLSKISQGCVFSKLDANSGFHQIPLDSESSELTAFITPFGRFKFKRLPYGITSAPEYFQKRMDKILQGLPGVLCHMDDILIWGRNKAEHDARLNAVLERLSQANLTLNSEKFEFARAQIEYLGQIVDSSVGGLRKDPAKVKAIVEMETPRNVADVRRFLGMVNQLMKFVPNLAEKTKPLRDLLCKDKDWIWGPDQENSFNVLKKDLASPEILVLYSPDRETVVSADSSSFGLGAVLLQRQANGLLHPVAYASRSLTATESRYAQIEKEALAVTWGLERWYDLLVGMHFTVQTDHKPLVPLFSTKNVDELPLRVQRFKMRLMRYSFNIVHVPGKDLCTADALSRAPLQNVGVQDIAKQADSYVQAVMVTIPASDKRLDEIRTELGKDDILKVVVHHTLNEWPEKGNVGKTLMPYYIERSSLSVHDGLLMKSSRIVIPETLRQSVLLHLHDGHQGVTKTRENAADSVWWPGLSSDIDKMVLTCPECAKFRRARVEPMKGTPFPSRAWSRIAADFFYLSGKQYLLAIDYFSRDIEIHPVTRANTAETIDFFKTVFARHGIADVLVSDNGPQFSSEEFRSFADSWGFVHNTSSPHYPQSNGEAERAVQTLKRLILKCEDPHLGLLMYRNTKLHNGFSPAQLSLGRSLKTRVPCLPETLLPRVPDLDLVRKREKRYREQVKQNYDRRHRVVAPESLSTGDHVWIPDMRKEGTVVGRHETPRSIVIETSDGAVLRRNRQMTRKLHSSPLPDPPFPDPNLTSPSSNLTHSPSRANLQPFAHSSPDHTPVVSRDARSPTTTPPGALSPRTSPHGRPPPAQGLPTPATPGRRNEATPTAEILPPPTALDQPVTRSRAGRIPKKRHRLIEEM